MTIGDVGQIILYTVTFICISLSIQGNLKLWMVSDEMFIVKRGKITQFGLNITIIIQMISFISSFITSIYLPNASEYFLMSSIFATISWWSFIYFSIVKSWMLYFRERWTFYSLQSECQC